MLIDTKVYDAAQTPESRILDPTTGEMLDRLDVDSLIDAYERIQNTFMELGETRRKIAFALSDLTTSEAKTRRLAGTRRRVKIEMPGDLYRQDILKEAWNSFPQFRDSYLRIDTVGIQKREFKKLLETTGPADLETFKKMLGSANVGPSGTPRIEVEV